MCLFISLVGLTFQDSPWHLTIQFFRHHVQLVRGPDGQGQGADGEEGGQGEEASLAQLIQLAWDRQNGMWGERGQ